MRDHGRYYYFCSYQVVDLMNLNQRSSLGSGEEVSLPQRGAGNEIAWEIRIERTLKHPQGLFPASPPRVPPSTLALGQTAEQARLCILSAAGMYESLGRGPGMRVGGEGMSLRPALQMEMGPTA